MNIPEEIYTIISSLVDDLETFYALSACNKMAYLGCMVYKRQIIQKYPLFDIYSYRKPIVLDETIPNRASYFISCTMIWIGLLNKMMIYVKIKINIIYLIMKLL